MRIAARIGSGSILSQPSLIATASTVASEPCSTRSRNCFEVLNKAAVGRIAPDHTADGHRARLLAAGDRCVEPLAARAFIRVGQTAHRRGFPARRPPVNHLRARRRCVRKHAHEEGNSDCR